VNIGEKFKYKLYQGSNKELEEALSKGYQNNTWKIGLPIVGGELGV